MHTAGVVHRDLKPGNILLGADGPWVIDFGIARAAEATRLTRSGAFIGTPQFMSPEHGMGAELTPSTDVFSLGLIAAVTATGRHPYGAGGPLTVATQIANTAQRPPDLSEQASGRAARAFDGRLPAPVAPAVAARHDDLEGEPLDVQDHRGDADGALPRPAHVLRHADAVEAARLTDERAPRLRGQAEVKAAEGDVVARADAHGTGDAEAVDVRAVA